MSNIPSLRTFFVEIERDEWRQVRAHGAIVDGNQLTFLVIRHNIESAKPEAVPYTTYNKWLSYNDDSVKPVDPSTLAA